MKVLGFAVCLLIMVSYTYADQVYFDFNIADRMFYSGREKFVGIKYALAGYSESDFIIRPVSDSQIFEIYNSRKGKWINEATTWMNYPDLSDNIKLRIDKIPGDKEDLFFSIQNRISGEIYATPVKKIFYSSSYNEYSKRVNKHLTSINPIEKEVEKETYAVSEEKNFSHTIIAGVKLLILPELLFVVLLVHTIIASQHGRIS